MAKRICFLLALLTPGLLFAQSSELSGLVKDPAGAVVPNASIEIRNQDTGIRQQTATNSDGLYSLPSLKPGNYIATVQAKGFKTLTRDGIVLEVAQRARLDLTLELGSVEEKVTVKGDASLVNSADGSVGMTVNRTLVDNLPLNGRTFQQLITLAAGVTLSSGAGYGQFVVNGQRPTANYVTIDGVSANIGITSLTTPGGTDIGSNAAGGTNSLVSVDGIQEFRLLTSSFSPEYGRTPGGQVIIETRSGTNEYHGAASEYFRNDVLNANDWFANANGRPRSALRFNDYGGVMGGPIVRDRTFFFFSYEGQEIRQPVFSISPVPNLTSRQAAPASTQPILDAFPLPNGPQLGNGQASFAAGYSNPVSTSSTSLRIDHVFNPKVSAFGRYNYAPSNNTNRGAGGFESLSDVQTNHFGSQTLTGGLAYVITPRIVNELRVNLSKSQVAQSYLLDGFGGAIPPGDGLLFPTPLTPQNSLAYVSLGFTQGQFYSGYNSENDQRQINLIDNVSYVAGSHQLKFGIDYRRLLPYRGPYNGAGSYSFSGVNGVIANTVASFSRVYESRARPDLTNVSFYMQDAWRPLSKLTLTYGLRLEINTPPTDRDANNGNYVPLLGNYVTGAVQVGTAGSPLWKTQYWNFAPRLGAAYQLWGKPGWETVIKGGAGLFYDLGLGYSVFGPFIGAFPNLLITPPLSGVPFPVSPAQAVLPTVNLTNPPPGQSFYTFAPDFALPRIWQWNLSIQQSFGAADAITVAYVGALGKKLLYEQYFPGIVGPARYSVFYYDNEGSSSYNGFQLQFQHRLNAGLTATAGYTWSHSIDNASSDFGNLPPATYLPANSNRGDSDFDVRHVFHGALSYSFAGAGKAIIKVLTEGWGIDAIISAQSSLPLNITKTENIGFGNFALRPDVIAGVPQYIANANVGGGKQINAAAFVAVPTRQGNLARNALRGFDLAQADLSARRSFRLTERFRLLLRADLFNILNHPNFSNPIGTIGSGTFGTSTSMANNTIGGTGTGLGYGLNPVFQTGGPRSVQLSLKLQF